MQTFAILQRLADHCWLEISKHKERRIRRNMQQYESKRENKKSVTFYSAPSMLKYVYIACFFKITKKRERSNIHRELL